MALCITVRVECMGGSVPLEGKGTLAASHSTAVQAEKLTEPLFLGGVLSRTAKVGCSRQQLAVGAPVCPGF